MAVLPVYLLAGNHDDRDELRRAFPEHGYLQQCADPLQYVVESLAVRIVALDTVIPGESGGTLCGRRLEWLDRTLSRDPGRPTLVAMHHPPFVTGIGHMNRTGFSEHHELARVIARHP